MALSRCTVAHVGSNDRKADRATAALAEAICEAQGRRKMTTAALSRSSGVAYTTLRKIRTGEQPIDYEELRKITQALGVSPSSVVARAEQIEAL